MMFVTCGVAFFVFLISIPVSLIFEAPFINLKKVFLQKQRQIEHIKEELKRDSSIQ